MPLTSYCNPKPGLVAILSPSTYPPGGTQHLFLNSISIMANDFIFPSLWYNDRCEGKRRVRRCHKMPPAQRCLSHQLCSMVLGAGMGAHRSPLLPQNPHTNVPTFPSINMHVHMRSWTRTRAPTEEENITRLF